MRQPSLSKSFYLIFGVTGAILIAGGFVAILLMRDRIQTLLTAQYTQQQNRAVEQTAAALESEVQFTTDKLKFIASDDSIRSLDPQTCNEEVNRIIKLVGNTVGNLARVNPNGVFFCSYNKQLIGRKSTDLGTYITDLIKDPEHKPVMSRMIYPAGANSYLFGVHVPVYDKDGKFAGTLGGAINVNDLAKNYLNSFNEEGKLALSVFDNNGDIIHNRDKSRIGKNRYSPEFQSQLQGDLNQAFEKAVRGESSQVYYTFMGEKRLAMVSGFEIFPGRRWVINANVPVAAIIDSPEIVQVRQSLARLAAIYSAIVFFGIIIFLQTLRKTVFKPIKEFDKATKELQEGNMAVRIKYNGKNELGRLGGSFNLMIQKLQNYNKDLVATVQKQTQQLQELLDTTEKKNQALEDTKRAVLNILEDLNEEKAKVEAKSAKDEAILSGIGEGLIMLDNNGIVQLVNLAAEKLLGYSEKELMGKKFVEVVSAVTDSDEPISASERVVQKVINQRTAITASFQYITKDKEKLSVLVSAAPVIDNRKMLGVISVFRDISKEREIDRAKSEFVSLASHQLRTPLTAIGWYTEMMLAGEAGKISNEQKTYLAEIDKGNKRMVELVNSLLDVSRIETGTFRVDPVPTDIVEMAKDVVKETESEIFRRKQELVENYQPKIPKLNLDPRLIRMVIQNLLSNASKYTKPEGKIEVRIYTTKALICLEVSDNGYGIPKKQQPLIFKKLFRADNIMEVEAGGTGLGLYIIQSIVQQTGGKIWFESVQDKGTTFFVQLPLTGMKARKGLKELGTKE